MGPKYVLMFFFTFPAFAVAELCSICHKSSGLAEAQMPQQWIYSNLIFPVWWPCKISPVAKKWIKAIFQGRHQLRYVGKQKLISGNQERYWSSCISPLSLLADDCSSLGGHSSCHHRPNSGNISSVHYNSRKIGLSHFHPFFLFFSSLFLVGKKSSLFRFWFTLFLSLSLFYLKLQI